MYSFIHFILLRYFTKYCHLTTFASLCLTTYSPLHCRQRPQLHSLLEANQTALQSLPQIFLQFLLVLLLHLIHPHPLKAQLLLLQQTCQLILLRGTRLLLPQALPLPCQQRPQLHLPLRRQQVTPQRLRLIPQPQSLLLSLHHLPSLMIA